MSAKRRLEAGKNDYFKVHKNGNSRALSVTRLLPADWNMVRVDVVESSDGSVTLKIQPLIISA